VDINRDAVYAQRVSMGDLASTLATALGSSNSTDFPNNGFMQRVTIQADAARRMQPEDVMRLTVPNAQGQLVELSTMVSAKWISGPMQLTRYNGYPSMSITGQAKPGFTSGDAMKEMEKLAQELPDGFGYEWTGQSLDEKKAGSSAMLLYAFSILAVFLCLAALYESWSIPLSVLLVVPLGVFGAVAGMLMRGMPNDIYFQVALITVIGLSAKNAILIVEFAKDLHAEGKSALEAALEAGHLRFRPILMTSLAFILGVVPLYIASGASAASQKEIGTGVFWGMVIGTPISVFLVPVFFVAVFNLFGKKSKQDSNATPRRQLLQHREARNMNKTLLPVALAGALLASGCSFIPTLERPAAPVAEHYSAADEQAGTTAAADIPWQQFYTDPRLQQVIQLALDNNRDLRVAVLNIEKAQAQYQIQRAGQFPEFGVAGSASRQPSATTGRYANSYMVGLSMPSWEIDFWGRIGSLKQQALAQYLATEEGRKAAQISLIATVANTWLNLQADEELLAISRRTLGTREQSIKLTKLRWTPASLPSWTTARLSR
jgi:hypothetical protein